MEFCPHCRKMMPVKRKVKDIKKDNERHVQTICSGCQQVVFEAVRPLDQEPPEAEKPARPDPAVPFKHPHARPRPKKKA